MITRRVFAGALAALTVPPARSYVLQTVPGSMASRSGLVIAFQAVAAAQLPQMMFATAEGPREAIRIPASGFRRLASSPIFELRRYGWARSLTCQSPAAKESCFLRAGMSPLFTSTPGVVLIPFDSLAAREKAWAKLAADPEWTRICSAVTVNEISIYSPIS